MATGKPNGTPGEVIVKWGRVEWRTLIAAVVAILMIAIPATVAVIRTWHLALLIDERTQQMKLDQEETSNELQSHKEWGEAALKEAIEQNEVFHRVVLGEIQKIDRRVTVVETRHGIPVPGNGRFP